MTDNFLTYLSIVFQIFLTLSTLTQIFTSIYLGFIGLYISVLSIALSFPNLSVSQFFLSISLSFSQLSLSLSFSQLSISLSFHHLSLSLSLFFPPIYSTQFFPSISVISIYHSLSISPISLSLSVFAIPLSVSLSLSLCFPNLPLLVFPIYLSIYLSIVFQIFLTLYSFPNLFVSLSFHYLSIFFFQNKIQSSCKSSFNPYFFYENIVTSFISAEEFPVDL
ncbi:unnamed protein product [Acanthosepion pharaonis]|uniref:Uncharacterized protein n=1 Tax=Acanthosepion pharaonis TaxID=158019 RepID=A0A812CVP5_ACAPH|nr:unnamed protein product [Sepia pharaonis]